MDSKYPMRIHYDSLIGFDDVETVDPPGIWLKYDCISQAVLMDMEWCGVLADFTVASSTFNLLEDVALDVVWNFNVEEAVVAHKKFLLNEFDVQGLIQTLDYVHAAIGSHCIKVQNISSSLDYLKRVKSILCDTNCKALDEYGDDLVYAAYKNKLTEVLGHDLEIEKCMEILAQRTKYNCILIDDPSIPSLAITKSLAQRIFQRNVPETLPKRLISLNMAKLKDNSSHNDKLEERLISFFNEIRISNRGIILFIDNIHLILDDKDMPNAIKLFKSMLAENELCCIVASPMDKYKRYIKQDSTLEKYFEQVLVKEPTVNVCVSILRRFKENIELHFKVPVLDSALITAAELSNQYIVNEFLPYKAMTLVNTACEKIKAQMKNKSEILDQSKIADTEHQNLEENKQQQTHLLTNRLTPDVIINLVSELTGIPVTTLSEVCCQHSIPFEHTLQED